MNSRSDISLENLPSSHNTTDTAVEDVQAAQSAAVSSSQPNERSTPHLEPPPTNGVPPGYPKLAERMGLAPEVAVFRRFAFLNKLNLLHLQAELVEIENQLKETQDMDSKREGYERFYARDWFFLNRSAVEGDNTQLNLLLSAREKLERYNTALIQQSHILPMQPPAKSDLNYIQKFIASKEMGPFALDGLDAEVWGNIHQPKGHAPDIITLLPREKEDMFSDLLTDHGLSKWFKWGFDKNRKPSQVSGLVWYGEGTLRRVTLLVTTALASLLPILSIVVLYYVRPMKARLGIIAAFNVLISFCLALFTSAKRTDIFAVTAAFSAVQVVFVQGENGEQV